MFLQPRLQLLIPHPIHPFVILTPSLWRVFLDPIIIIVIKNRSKYCSCFIIQRFKNIFGESWVTSYAADAPIFPLDFDNNDPTIEARALLDKQGTEVPVGEVGSEAVLLAYADSGTKPAAATGDGRKASAAGAKPAASTGDGGKAAATGEVAANGVDGTWYQF